MTILSDAATRRAVTARIAALTPHDSARWGRMSAHQMLCHLSDAYRYALGECPAESLPVPVPRPLFKWMALRAPVRWPHGIQSPPEMAQDCRGTPPLDFDSDRARLLAFMDRFCSSLPEPPLPHPYFGRMTQLDWMRWGYRHTDHHLRQFGR